MNFVVQSLKGVCFLTVFKTKTKSNMILDNVDKIRCKRTNFWNISYNLKIGYNHIKIIKGYSQPLATQSKSMEFSFQIRYHINAITWQSLCNIWAMLSKLAHLHFNDTLLQLLVKVFQCKLHFYQYRENHSQMNVSWIQDKFVWDIWTNSWTSLSKVGRGGLFFLTVIVEHSGLNLLLGCKD